MVQSRSTIGQQRLIYNFKVIDDRATAELEAEVAKAVGLAEAIDVPKFQGLRHNDTALAVVSPHLESRWDWAPTVLLEATMISI